MPPAPTLKVTMSDNNAHQNDTAVAYNIVKKYIDLGVKFVVGGDVYAEWMKNDIIAALNNVRKEYDQIIVEADKKPDINDNWRKDRPGLYWCRWPELDWIPHRYLGFCNGLEIWETGGRPPIVGPRVRIPDTLLDKIR